MHRLFPYLAITLGVFLASPALAAAPLTLDDAVTRALATSPVGAVSRADVAIASAGVLASGRWSNPTLSGEVDSSEQTLTLKQDLPVWGAPGREWQAARSGLVAAGKRQDAVTASLRANVTRAYFKAFADQQRAALSRQSLQLDSLLLSIVRKRFQSGDVPRLEVIAAESQLSAGKAEHLAADANATASQAALNLLMWQAEAPSWDLATPSVDPALVASAEASTSAAVGADVADLQQTSDALSAARARRWSEPALILGARRLAPPEAGPQGEVLAHGGLEIGIPAWNAGQGEIAAAKARQERARAMLDQAVLEAESAVSRGRAALDAAEQRVVLNESRIAQSRELLDLARQSFSEGASNALYVIEAQRQWQAARAERLDAIEAEGDALAELLPYMP